MESLNLTFLLIMAGVLFAVVIHGKFGRRKSRLNIAKMQFFEMALHSETSRFSFNPKTATIVRQDFDQTDGESTTYAITIYARNESGEYFVYRSDGLMPSINHLEHRIAKVILKNEYLPPSEPDNRPA